MSTILIDQRPIPIADAFALALRQHETGGFAVAGEIYQAILAVAPDHAGALHLSGLLLLQAGETAAAHQRIARAVAIEPATAPFRNSLGNVLMALGRPGEAVDQYRRALALRPGAALIANNLGNALRGVGRLEEAVGYYRQALAQAPGVGDFLYNLANALVDQGKASEAEPLLRAAAAANPPHAGAAFNLGHLLIGQSRWLEAEAALRTAIRLNPAEAGAWSNLGTVLQQQERLGDAETCYRRAVGLAPAEPEFLYNLGCVLLAQNRTKEAGAAYAQVLALAPDHGGARFAAVMAELPILYQDSAEVARSRAAYAAALDQLEVRAAASPAVGAWAAGVGTSQPFFLAYQGQNDRALQDRYGRLVTRILAEHYGPADLPPPPAAGARIRVGIVSGFFQDHTIWKLFLEGWLARLDRDRFEVTAYHTGARRDGVTDRAAAAADQFRIGLGSGARWREQILADRPDALLYPEIGMDPLAAHLAAQRLARFQAVSWGHPDTTGLPTIDAFLSSDLMEPVEGAADYTERLVRLPDLGVAYQPDPTPPPPPNQAVREPDPTIPHFWSGQALYKYHPDHDGLYPAIARAVGPCRFLFIGFAKSAAVTDLFRRRLAQAFAAEGLDAEAYCRFLAPMDQRGFLAAAGACDLLLDTPGWSGGRSTLDCLALGRPMITWPGALMRSRHTAAILTRIGVPDTIATDRARFIALAADLARDPLRREAIAARMVAGRAAAYDHTLSIRALEAVIEAGVR